MPLCIIIIIVIIMQAGGGAGSFDQRAVFFGRGGGRICVGECAAARQLGEMWWGVGGIGE